MHHANTPSSTETLLTVRQAAEFLRLSQRTVRRMIADGRLPAMRIGRSIRISRAAYNQFVATTSDANSHIVKPQPP